MKYTVKHEDIYSLQWEIKDIIDNQNQAIDNLESKIQSFIDYEDFKGKNADSSKAYMAEVHLNLLKAIRATNQTFLDSLVYYKTRYYGLESVSDDSGCSTSFVLPQEYMTQFADTLDEKFEETMQAAESVESAISQVVSRGNIPSYSLPSLAGLYYQSNDLSTRIRTLDENIEEHEAATVANLKNNAEAMMAYISGVIANIDNSGGYSSKFTTGNFSSSEFGSTLISVTNQLNQIHNTNAKAYDDVKTLTRL